MGDLPTRDKAHIPNPAITTVFRDEIALVVVDIIKVNNAIGAIPSHDIPRFKIVVMGTSIHMHFGKGIEDVNPIAFIRDKLRQFGMKRTYAVGRGGTIRHNVTIRHSPRVRSEKRAHHGHG